MSGSDSDSSITFRLATIGDVEALTILRREFLIINGKDLRLGTRRCDSICDVGKMRGFR